MVRIALQPERQPGRLVSKPGEAKFHPAGPGISRGMDNALCVDCVVRLADLERGSIVLAERSATIVDLPTGGKRKVV